MAEQYETRAYRTKHVEIQRQQPTVLAVQQATEHLKREHGRQPMLAELQDHFPGGHPKLVEVAFNDLLHAMVQEEWAEELSKTAIDSCLQEVAATELLFGVEVTSGHSGRTLCSDAAARIAQLHAKLGAGLQRRRLNAPASTDAHRPRPAEGHPCQSK